MRGTKEEIASAGACFLFPCKSRSANPQETAGGGAVEGQERAVCELILLPVTLKISAWLKKSENCAA
jgi:hypothetical protein